MYQIVFNNAEFCFICHEFISSCRNKLSTRLGHSEKSLLSLIESFIELPLAEDFLSAEAAVCQGCMIKINEYDQLMSKATLLKNDLIGIFRSSQESAKANLFQSEMQFTEFTAWHPNIELGFQLYEEARPEESQFNRNDEVSEDFRKILEKEGIAYDIEVFQRAFGEDEVVETEKKMKSMFPSSKNFIENLSCDFCNMTGFQSRRTFIAHLKAHKKNQFYCAKCDVSFKAANSFKVHLSTDHGNMTKNIPCPFDSCQKKFTNKISLKAHLICHNRDEKQPSFVCDTCGKGFHYKISFTQHLKIHSGVRDKQCDSCGFKAISSTHLKRHVRARHTKEKNHICNYCNRAFSERYNMTSHIRKQHLEKKQPLKKKDVDLKFYKCSICCMEYSDESKFINHLEQAHNITEIIFDKVCDVSNSP